METISLTAFFPAYNDQHTIEGIVRTAAEEMRKVTDDFEVLVVDDGSKDQTGAILDRLAAELPYLRVIHHQRNLGYGAALIQSRRFAEAVSILRKAITATPNNYTAHANLATALYELKQFAPALDEYEWLLKAKPDLTVAYYFIAIAHDYLGEYEQALSAYESFLGRADAKTNQLEIEKIKLRLPSLRRHRLLRQRQFRPA